MHREIQTPIFMQPCNIQMLNNTNTLYGFNEFLFIFICYIMLQQLFLIVNSPAFCFTDSVFRNSRWKVHCMLLLLLFGHEFAFPIVPYFQNVLFFSSSFFSHHVLCERAFRYLKVPFLLSRFPITHGGRISTTILM